MLTNFIIFSGFAILVLGYYKFLHNGIMSNLDKRIEKISNEISYSSTKIEEYTSKIDLLEKELLDTDISFKETCKSIAEELNQIRAQKIQIVEEEMRKATESIESQVDSDYSAQETKIKDKIIENAYLLAIEYFKTKENYPEAHKKKILERLFKSIKVN